MLFGWTFKWKRKWLSYSERMPVSIYINFVHICNNKNLFLFSIVLFAFIWTNNRPGHVPYWCRLTTTLPLWWNIHCPVYFRPISGLILFVLKTRILNLEIIRFNYFFTLATRVQHAWGRLQDSLLEKVLECKLYSQLSVRALNNLRVSAPIYYDVRYWD